ncbi:MAG: DNA cytosine methyltransferase [Paludibacteraceae bacterium]|nr:DNA cytosine methyltransferase [Paludibacteraceae bacterium]
MSEKKEFVSHRKKITYLDLFSGCGGLLLGFEMVVFDSILAIDNWKCFCHICL